MDASLEPDQELFAIYNSIGYLQDGLYFKEPDCNACLKDLLRFLRVENQQTFNTRRQLAKCNFLATDLAPLVKQHCVKDKVLFDLVLRLLSSLTLPPILLYKEQVPDDKEQRKVFLDLQQQAFAQKTALCNDVMFWSVISKQMVNVLHMKQDHRQEEDKVQLERILILIRNLLHTASYDEEEVIAGENNTHDKLLISMKKACIFDLIRYICETVAEHEFAFHVLEIFSYIYREQDAECLATLTESLRLSETEKRKDIEHLKELRARAQSNRVHQDKFQRFKESTYVVKNLKSIGEKDMICHKAISDIGDLNLDSNKKVIRKAKNRRHYKDENTHGTHSSSLELKSHLRDLAIELISKSYNLLIRTVRYYLERQSSQENDETYFIWAAQFFMEFNRCSNADVEYVSETLSKEFLHYLHCLIEKYLDHLKTEKKNARMWARRLHLGLKAYKELIYTLAHLQSKLKNQSASFVISEELRRKLFYEEDYRELLRMLITVYDPIKMSDAYLLDLIETNHLFFKMLEHFCKKSTSQVIIRKKARKQKKRKKIATFSDENSSEDQPELIWTQLASEISDALQGVIELPQIESETDLNVFSGLSEESKDDQKLIVMKKINLLLHTKRAKESVALLREARNFFNDDLDDNTFGAVDIPLDEELVVLRNILMNDFLLECNNGEFVDLKKKGLQSDQILSDEVANEEEESEDEKETYKEHSFKFNDFVKSFASQKILQPYWLAFQNYATNSIHVNNCIIRMFHRLAFDCSMYCMFFQLSFFRMIQKILNCHHHEPAYIELIRFNKFIVNKFIQVAQNNPNIFIEMLYSKSSKESYIAEHGHEEIIEMRSLKKIKKTTSEEKECSDSADFENSTSEKEDENQHTAAEKYDKLFGINKSDLESTRLEMAENQTESDQDSHIFDVDSTRNSSQEIDRRPNKSSSLVRRKKVKKSKLLDLGEEMGDKAKVETKKIQLHVRTKRRKIIEMEDSDLEEPCEAEYDSQSSVGDTMNKNDLKSKKIFDSDSESINDDSMIDSDCSQSLKSELLSKNMKNEEENIPIELSETKSNNEKGIIEINYNDRIESKSNETGSEKRKRQDSDNEDAFEERKSNETVFNNKKRRLVESDDEAPEYNSNEKENLNSHSQEECK